MTILEIEVGTKRGGEPLISSDSKISVPIGVFSALTNADYKFLSSEKLSDFASGNKIDPLKVSFVFVWAWQDNLGWF